MQTILKRNGLLVLIGVLLFTNVFIWQAAFASPEHGFLTVAVLDIGQGDSIYIEGPDGTEVLVDGGPDGKVLSELGKVMPFGDISLDVLIVTNPDKDHYGGFLDVLKKYNVGEVLEPGTETPGETYRIFKRELADKHIPVVLARRDMALQLGDGAVLRILFPDRDVSNFSTNDGSIIMRLDYGSTSVMLSGDTTKLIEEYMVNRYQKDLPATILKVAHHGSKTSSGSHFVEAVSPEYAVISDGKNNKYGHPHQVTLDTLLKYGIRFFRTDQEGTTVFESDGKSFVFR